MGDKRHIYTNKEPKRIQKRKNLKAVKIARYVIVGLAVAFALFPIVWTVLTSVKFPSDILHSPPIWLPKELTFAHYIGVQELNGYKSFKDSLIIAGLSTACVVVIGSLAAYSITRWKTGGKSFPLGLLTLRVLPPIAVVFPVFLFFKELRIIDTYLAIILMHLVFNLPFTVWMMRGFFREIPQEAQESARIDGCSEVGVFWRVVLPLAAPGLIVTAMFCFIFSWQEYPYALILARRRVIPLSVFLPSLFGQQMIMWGEVGAISTISMLPLFALGILARKYFVRGLTMGTVK